MRPEVDAGRVNLDSAYEAMAADERREADAVAWADETIGDVADEPDDTPVT